MRHGFILYEESASILLSLPAEKAGEVIQALFPIRSKELSRAGFDSVNERRSFVARIELPRAFSLKCEDGIHRLLDGAQFLDAAL